ncbi:hypothetical protein [Dyadobacter psychrotolerans]|uniref:Lipoprotein n=1 Tax=Dyadobacter psychrotolerans TaxID=2541721 RepID=A0A4R5DNJ9_9BACT|nr:hypothetical protein [Dyadobacter psychrotolerans]TDE12475.1 hypothetical protein E0F88_22545 [Dyadobacter psychrotolerans]
MKVFNFSRKLIALAFLVSASLSCSNDSDTNPEPTYDIALKETTAGKVLVDENGKTLYFFAKDVAGTSACSGGCVDTWPLFSKSASKLDPALNATDFGSITRADGKSQTTFKGWPLYYYKNDLASGDVKGENVGSVWFVAKPTYTIMFANAQLIGKDGKLYTSDYKEGTGETQFFVDGMGRTLYAFANDKKNQNKFTTNVETHDASWPIYVAELKDLPSTLDKSLFTTIDVFGKKQLTYKGWPLYYFGNDNQKRGLTKGVDSPRTGVWPIVNKESPVAPD